MSSSKRQVYYKKVVANDATIGHISGKSERIKEIAKYLEGRQDRRSKCCKCIIEQTKECDSLFSHSDDYCLRKEIEKVFNGKWHPLVKMCQSAQRPSIRK